ncbi:MAG: TetR/AcrR family transcriptional regulator [Winogradskyella sp.]|uniref:TetR family transcriptional regulator C-terminal domain-containing protein n=1 Tax=Winogradskyella sp. TaxID=1883156 RepID=UPI000F3DD1C9|nr:TetR family transcriptional regulator C-terminal domain-containing protein [Winogradskyella sp.]RNC86478.1 MAG: TetR/AcrR family transcriptional regulator [Winogradskyella sp.]
MSSKKSIEKIDIITYYMEYVESNGKTPKSIEYFIEKHDIEIEDFDKHFNSFEDLEQDVFKIFFDNTVSLLNKSEDYHAFEAKDKLLSFYYTFFEILTANREYVEISLDRCGLYFSTPNVLKKLKANVLKFIDLLDIDTIDFKQQNIENIQKKAIRESAWIQLYATLKFWLDDTSEAFEKTDVYIEKSIKASFDLIDTTALKSIIDFGKFIYKEQFKSSD